MIMQEHRIVTSMVDDSAFVPSMLLAMESDAYLIEAFECQAVLVLHDAMADFGAFDEATALFYAATTFLGFEFLHSKGVAYRNVSSETIMLNTLGYPMLMDCRFAQEIDEAEKFSDLCGSYAYLAPEQVSGAGHTHAVDYWALGVLIYEMITEKTPWATGNSALDTEEAYYSKIASHYNGGLHYPDAFSLELVGILDKLLEPTVKQRIATPKEFRSNAWLQVVNWQQLERHEVVAPHAPEVATVLGEKQSRGVDGCLKASEYTGSPAWFDGFAPAASGGGASRNLLPPTKLDNRTTSVAPALPAVPAGVVDGVTESPEESERAKKKKTSIFGKGRKDAVTL